MFNNRIKHFFESDNTVTGYLSLKKTEIDDATLLNHLSIKPSEINILLARTASFIQNDPKVTKKELINDILEVLERSSVSREFVGIGLLNEYKLYKGFPVRTGDPYESMPEAKSEMVLKPSEIYIGWTTDLPKAKEDSIRYDAAKGEPIGGLLVQVHVDPTKVLFDINAVIKAVKAKKAVIDQYNTQAAPGKSISKANTEFLANEAPIYHGQWEIITNNKVTTVTVVNKWVWDETSGKKTVKWGATEQQTPEQQQLQEQINSIFENITLNESEDFNVNEGIWQGTKNIISKMVGTVRGKRLKYLKYKKHFFAAEKQMLQAAILHAKNLGEDALDRLPKLEATLENTENNLADSETELSNYENERYYDPPAQTKQATSTSNPVNDDADALYKHL